MTEILLIIVVLLLAVSIVLSVLVLRARRPGAGEDAGRALRDELSSGRKEAGQAFTEQRRELGEGMKSANSTLQNSLNSLAELQRNQLESVTRRLGELAAGNQQALDRMTVTLDTRVKELQKGNEARLEEMRRTVDEKLHETLERRLGESFKLVSERLDKVHTGLGEMQSLAAGVGDLKKVLTNVKARGTWAEVQLGALLEQILTPDQFGRNVKTRPESGERVEYAVKLPGRGGDPQAVVWLPVDSKFPQEDYARLQDAAERGDAEGAQKATAALTRAVQKAAGDIRDRYLEPPHTTDFAILYLATEGLYAEILRQPGLVESLQQTYRVVVAGPTTISAILSSLRMGFQTLAIEKRASEVWKILAAVKTEFGKFGDVLEMVKRQISTVARTIDRTGQRTRAMERRLRDVEHLPQAEAENILQLPSTVDDSRSEGGSDDEITTGGRPDALNAADRTGGCT